MHAMLWGLTIALLLLPVDQPVLRRHDRPDEQYLALGKEYGMSVCSIGGAAGTLIADRWILTAAHVASNISPFSRSVVCGGASIPIADVYSFPQWRAKTGADGDAIDLSIPDLALVRLSRAAAGVVPMSVYRQTDEVGQKIVVAGNGLTGTGETGPSAEDGKLRAATNVVDSLADQYFTFTFSAPDDPSVTPLEGIGGPGDSGGPAIVKVNGRLFVAGVSSLNSRGPLGPSAYGSTEVYARTSTSAGWIDSTMAGRWTADPVEDTVRNLTTDGWPREERAMLVKRWIDTFNGQDSAEIAAFNRIARTDSSLAVTSAEQRAKSSRGTFSQWGPITAHRYVATPGKPFMLLVHSNKLDRWMRLEFAFEGERGDKLGRMMMSSPEDPPGV